MTGIYYCDLFEINGKGCLIMGSGKSKVCRHFTGTETKELGTDSIRLELSDQKLFGYFDALMGEIPIEKIQMPYCEIRYLVRMLSSEETNCDEIQEISKDEFIDLCYFNIRRCFLIRSSICYASCSNRCIPRS